MSKSFGEWYDSQKKESTEEKTRASSWLLSFRKPSGDGDVETTGLLAKTKGLGAKLYETSDKIKLVIMFFGLAALFFLLAYILGIPNLLFRPAKFAISFTMGSLMTLCGIAAYQGPTQYISGLFKKEQLWKSILYFASLFFTIVFSIVKKSYIGTITMSLCQVGILAVLVLEAFPAGSRITSVLITAVKKIVSMIIKLFSRFFQ